MDFEELIETLSKGFASAVTTLESNVAELNALKEYFVSAVRLVDNNDVVFGVPLAPPVLWGVVWIFVDERPSQEKDSTLRKYSASARADVLVLQTNAIADERSLAWNPGGFTQYGVPGGIF